MTATSRSIVLDSFARLEDQSTRQDVRRALNTLADKLSTLESEVTSYAAWDDAYAFMDDLNQRFVTLLDHGPMLIATHAIQNSQGQGPSRGTFLMGRYLDAGEMDELQHTTQLTLGVYPLDRMPASTDSGVLQSLRQGTMIVVQPQDASTIAAYTLLTDVVGSPVSVLRVVGARSVYAEGQNTLRYFLAALLLAFLVFGALVLLFLERSVLTRLARLSAGVAQIGSQSDFTARVTEGEHDELGRLARSINTMLGALDNAQELQKETEKRYRSLIENGMDGVMVVDSDCIIRYQSPAVWRILRYTVEETIGRSGFDLVHPDDVGRCKEFMDRVRVERQETRSTQGLVRFCHKDGSWREIEITATDLSEEPGINGIVLNYRDITERKRAEEKLLYMSNHDALTGLYNRVYFEEVLAQLSQGNPYPISVVIVDIDGMKRTNDTKGHAAGDELLRRTAEVLKSAYRKEDIVARIGGDEFAMLLPQTDYPAAISMVDCLKLKLSEQNSSYTSEPLSLSIGAATAYEFGRLTQSISNADEQMYRDKKERRHIQAQPAQKNMDEARPAQITAA